VHGLFVFCNLFINFWIIRCILYFLYTISTILFSYLVIQVILEHCLLEGLRTIVSEVGVFNFYFISMITTEIIAPSAKLKIKFSTKMMEVDSVAKREFGREVSHTDERRRFNSNGKSSGLNSNKRGQPDSNEGQKVKRQRVDRKWSVQCATILKSLMAHPYGWVFNNPVDPVALNIPDYFNIIKSPMDFGTIKAKLEKNDYSGTEDFADDVRLTFSNATTYNPPGNDVHMMAQALRKIFDRKWKDLVRKLKCEDERSRSESGTIKEASGRSLDTMHSRHKDSWPKNTHVSEKKGIPKSISSACKDASVSVIFNCTIYFSVMHLYSLMFPLFLWCYFFNVLYWQCLTCRWRHLNYHIFL